jgi:outer membrane protein OmpA-like peptidoglycan-associated protein
MRRVWLVVVITVLASFSTACVASRKFVRNEVKTSADTLNGRIDTTEAEVGEVRDGVSRVDSRVTGVDGRVTQLDAKTNERFDGVKSDVMAVDRKAATAQTSADRASNEVVILDEKFQNRNLFTVAAEKAILFKFDSSKLDAKYESDLEGVVSTLKQNPNALVVLEGRTDSSGNQDYNIKLGERRVETVKRFLAVDMGIPVYRIHQISFGAAKPIAANDSREGREKNRAVIVTILVPKASSTVASKQNQNQ